MSKVKKIGIIVGVFLLAYFMIAIIYTNLDDAKQEPDPMEGLTENQRIAAEIMINNCRYNTGYLQSEALGKRIEELCMPNVLAAIEKMKKP